LAPFLFVNKHDLSVKIARQRNGLRFTGMKR
jgi:hypothetical protein